MDYWDHTLPTWIQKCSNLFKHWLLIDVDSLLWWNSKTQSCVLRSISVHVMPKQLQISYVQLREVAECLDYNSSFCAYVQSRNHVWHASPINRFPLEPLLDAWFVAGSSSWLPLRGTQKCFWADSRPWNSSCLMFSGLTKAERKHLRTATGTVAANNAWNSITRGKKSCTPFC